MKIFLSFCFITAIILSGCSNDATTIQIIRNPSMSFTLNGISQWKADSHTFAPVSKVVVYPADTSQSGQLYNRYILQATGKDNSGKSYQIIVSFDNSDNNNLVGIYKQQYTTQCGLAQVQLFNLTNSNNLSAYNICTNDTTAFLQIQKQNPDESLITGVFQMTLCNQRDTSEKILITNGKIKDIKY